MLKFLLYIWQLPQNVLGYIVVLFSNAKPDAFVKYLYLTESNFGVSLGDYIILNKYCTSESIMHELGHKKQSKIFGPLYLIVVGIPSLARNIYDRIFHRDWSYEDRSKWYFSAWPEDDADKRGNVKRK